MLKRSFAEPVSTQTFSESLNLSPEPERDKSFLGNTRSALNLKDASDAEILQAYRQKYPDLSGASDDELAMALETRYNKAGFGERLVKTAGERSLENVSNVFDMGRAPVGDKEKRRREALSGLLPELKGDYKYYGGSDPFYMPEGEGFSAGVAEFLGTVLADLPLMAAAGVGGAGVTAKVGLSGVKGLTAREAIAGSLFAQTRKYDNERERLIGTLEEGALWAGMGVAGHYAGKGLKALAGKLRKGKGAISAGERAEVERELRNVEAAGTSPEKENWAAARAARTTPQEAAGYEWGGPKPGDSPFMRGQVEAKAAEEAQRVADGSHGAAWREFRQRRNPKLLPGGEMPRSANAAEVRTGRPEVRGEEPVDYTPRVVGVDAAGTLPGASGMVGGRYGRNGRRLIGNNGGRPAGARVEFTGGLPELPGKVGAGAIPRGGTFRTIEPRAGGTLSALQFRARQAGLSIFDKNGKPYSEAFLRARERARGGVLFNSGKAITTPDAELRGVYEEAARLGIETVNKEGKPYSKTFLNLRINKALKGRRGKAITNDELRITNEKPKHVPAGGEFMGLKAEKNPQVVKKLQGSGVTVTEKKVTPEQVAKRETSNVRRERVKPKREKKVKDTLDDSEIDMRLKGIFNYGNKKILDDFVSVLSPRQLEKYNKTIERLSGVLGKRNEKRGPVAQFLTNYQRNTDLLKEKVNAFENGENKPSVDTIKQLIERQNKLVDDGIKTHGYNDYELEYGDDFVFDKPGLKKALEEKGYKIRENKLEDVEALKEIPDYPELGKAKVEKPVVKRETVKVEQKELFGVGKNKKISVMDEETYLSINGADRQDIGDSALHKNLPYGKVRDRILDRQAKKDTELIEKRDRLRKEYREKIDRGELREPTRFEKLVNTAHGMSEKEAVQAARRILEKNGIDWKKSSVGNIVKNSEQAGAKDVTKSESFKKWFGDWEKDPVNASKVVDEQGRPLVVYHTGSMGNVYDMKKSRSYSGSPDYELPGIYTTSNKQESAAYGSKEQIKELYVSIKNPFTGDVNELQQRLGSYRKVMDHLKKNGYDGFIDKELDEYVAFSPEQIKSAIGNRGTFDTGDANILHGKAWPAGAVAGVERDDEGNVTFDAGKAVKGMAAMAVGEAGLKILARNAKNAGRMGIVAEGFAKGEKGKPLSEKVAKAAERYGKKETGPGGQGGVGGQVKPGKPKTRNEIYDEAAKYVGKHGRNTVLRDSWEGTKEVANKLFVPVASRLERINPKLGRKLRRHEFDLGMRITRDVKAVTPFMEVTKKMTPVEKLVLDIARKNGDDEKILELMHRYGGVEQYQAYRKVMDDVYKRAKEVGFDLDYRLHYHPRMVKDKRGFLKYFEMSEDWSAIEAAMKEQAAKLQRPLTEDEKVNLVNSLLRGFQKTKIGLPETGSMKERTIEQIDFALNKFYYDSNSSLQMYLNGVNDRIESRRFFGIHGRTAKGKGWMPDAEKTFGVNDAGIEKQEDLKDSIGAYVLDLIKKGEITASDENQVREILQARFHQEGAHGIVALYKNLSYMETMGSFASALTQLGDVAYSLYRTGFYGTAKNIVKSAKTLKDPGAQRISLEDIGVDRIAQEFMAEGNSGKWLDRVFKMTGLTTLDRMGKLTYINAVMDKYMKLARNEKPGGGLKDFVLNKESRAEFMGRLERVFGKDTDKVLADLKAGKVTEDVRYLAFSELLGIQPVALSEMPQNYLSGGNGRIFYMLKTYSLKQWDAYRREALDLMKTDPKRGMRNLMYLSGALLGCNASADMLKNLMLNRDTEPDDLVVDNVARLFGLSKWTIYEARREGAATAAMKMMLPPGKFLDAAYKDASDTYRYFVDDVEVKNYGAKNLNLFGSIPLVGKPYFWWFGKGSEWEKNKSKPRKSGSAKVERARRRYGRRRSR